MTRPLLLTAAFGFVAAFVCFAIVAALGPVDWENWSFHGDSYGWRGWRAPVAEGGPQTNRDLVWGGTDALTVDVPAEVTYTQGAVARLTVSGPQGAVDHLVADGGVLRFDRPMRGGGGLQIALTAPSVRKFTLNGAERLDISGFDQDHLELNIRGHGDVVAKGRARDTELSIAGSGDVDLGGVEAESAEVTIAGSGDATVAPRRRAEVLIAGSGDVTLTTQPPELTTKILGSGRILHAAPPLAPSTPAPVTPPPKNG